VLGVLAVGLGPALGAEVWPTASPAAAALAERALEAAVVESLGGAGAVGGMPRDGAEAAVEQAASGGPRSAMGRRETA
jgi:hypothetical protein